MAPIEQCHLSMKFAAIPIIVILLLSIPYFSTPDSMTHDDAAQIAAEEQGFTGLLELTDSSEGLQKQALEAIALELKNGNENPEEFFVRPEPLTLASQFAFSLVHRDSFRPENLNKVGNPSGKDRKATYQFTSKKVTFAFYQ